MARGLRDIKRQIKSVQETRQITRAMKVVAASKLKKAQDKAQASRPYSEKLKEVVFSIAGSSSGISHPMLQSRPVKKTGYLVITSDRGLAGGYNANILREVMDTIRTRHTSKDDYVLFVIGRKGIEFFRRREIPVVASVTDLSDAPTFADIKSLAYTAVRDFEEEKFEELFICYNQFINALTQKPVVERLLPLSDVGSNGVTADYEYEPSPEGVLRVLLPKYAETLIYSALLEGKASELGAKMTAMGNATDNATNLLGELKLTYNRARQAAITQEISEIVAGANAQS